MLLPQTYSSGSPGPERVSNLPKATQHSQRPQARLELTALLPGQGAQGCHEDRASERHLPASQDRPPSWPAGHLPEGQQYPQHLRLPRGREGGCRLLGGGRELGCSTPHGHVEPAGPWPGSGPRSPVEEGDRLGTRAQCPPWPTPLLAPGPLQGEGAGSPQPTPRGLSFRHGWPLLLVTLVFHFYLRNTGMWVKGQNVSATLQPHKGLATTSLLPFFLSKNTPKIHHFHDV